ncbi:MAG: sigma-70 family RNA polymerase sigma factor [Polyangia bacterium]
MLHRFCLNASAVFRGEARRVLLAIGKSDRQLEEDLSHDMIEVMLKNNMQELRKWRPELGSLRCYLRIVANRRIHDRLRSRDYPRSCERMMEAAELAALPGLRTPASGSEISDEERDFWQKFRALFELHVPADQQQLYRRCYVDEEEPEQVAAALGISIDALYKRLSRLRKLLFELRDRLLDEGRRQTPQA